MRELGKRNNEAKNHDKNDNKVNMKKLLIIIVAPFKVILENKGDFLIWFLFTIVTGQLGVIANFIVRHYSNKTKLIESIYMESNSGSFYTFSIALVASLLGPIFLNFIKNEKLLFKTLKVFTIIVAIFYLFITSVIYASVQIQSETLFIPPFKDLSIDFTQIFIYTFAIFLASYGYCVLELEKSKLNFDMLKDPLFNEQNDKHVETILTTEPTLTQDSNGVAL